MFFFFPDSVKKSGALVVKRTETIPLDDHDEVNITETSRIQDNSTINQSQTTSYETKPLQPLVEKVDNLQKVTSLEKSTFSKCVKTKTVSISDDVEEHEIEKRDKETDSENIPRPKQKGRTLTAVKHISKENSKTVKDVNECKSQ